MPLSVKPVFIALTIIAGTLHGCISLPDKVAEELKEPASDEDNNYKVRSTHAKLTTDQDT